jgi:hypothetical protein
LIMTAPSFRGTGNLTVAALFLDAALLTQHTAHNGQPPTIENGLHTRVLSKCLQDNGISVSYQRHQLDDQLQERYITHFL